MALYDKSSVQILKAIEQEFTEHGAVLHAFLVLTARHVIQSPGVGLDRIQQPSDYRAYYRAHNGRGYIVKHLYLLNDKRSQCCQ